MRSYTTQLNYTENSTNEQTQI